MGQRMKKVEIEYGNHCTHCFANGETPKYVYARFINVVKCKGVGKEACLIPPNDRTFKLTQRAGFPCSWSYLGSTWEVWYLAWRAPDNIASLQLIDFNHQVYFERTLNQCQPEGTVWHNSIDCAPGLPCGENGIAVVTWTPQATQLLKDIVIEKGKDLFMELFPLDDGNLVYKFCRIAESTNVKILFSPP